MLFHIISEGLDVDRLCKETFGTGEGERGKEREREGGIFGHFCSPGWAGKRWTSKSAFLDTIKASFISCISALFIDGSCNPIHVLILTLE